MCFTTVEQIEAITVFWFNHCFRYGKCSNGLICAYNTLVINFLHVHGKVKIFKENLKGVRHKLFNYFIFVRDFPLAMNTVCFAVSAAHSTTGYVPPDHSARLHYPYSPAVYWDPQSKCAQLSIVWASLRRTLKGLLVLSGDASYRWCVFAMLCFCSPTVSISVLPVYVQYMLISMFELL